MKKLLHKSDKFYRVLLFMGGFLYLLFVVFFQQIPQVQDPMSLGHRGIGAFIFFSIFFSSFFSTWIKQRLDQLTRLAAALAIVHMIIINHITGYNFTMAVSIIVVIIFINLIFKGDKLALYSNGILAILVGISLFLAKLPPAFRFTYFLAYTSSAGLTYYISLSKLREEMKIRNINQKQDILLNTIDTKIWYLTDKDAYGRVNQAFAEFLGRDKTEVENKEIKEILPKEKAANCIEENEVVFKNKEKLQIESWMVNSAGESRLLSITKKPKVNQEGEVEYVVCSAQDITEIKKKEEELRNNRDLLSSILEVQKNLVILLNPEGEIIKFNRACEQVLGYSYEEVKNKKIWDILIKEDEIDQTKEVFNTIKTKKKPLEYENYLKTKEGELRLISWNNNVLLDKNNEIKYIVATGNDITEKSWREKILKKSQEIANVGSWELHLKHNQLIWSDETYRIFGLAPQEFEATYEAFLQAIHPDDREEVDEAYTTSVAEKKNEYEIEHRIIRQDNGQIRYVREKCEHIRNDKGEIVRSLGIVQDITDRKEREKKIKYLLYRDILTDLYNRRFFEEEIDRLDTERQLPLSIIMSDIDNLKLVNDRFGHKKGDELIVKTARILEKAVRKEDILARWGGDEFSILLPETDKKEAQKVTERIHEKCLATQEDPLPVSLSIGLAVKTQVDQEIEEIMHEADKAMYQEKND